MNGIVYVNGTKIVRSVVDTGEEIWYNYGVNGIHGITVKKVGESASTEYVFRKNVQGDVTHIYKINNGNLELVAQYKYDAWGKCEVVNSVGSEIGNINPIRYRGYYYDTDTGLYYLNARYYDPETGRFISADSTQYLEPNAINGLNLYAYCANNPVMNVDPSGQWLLSILIAGLIGAAISGVFNAVEQAVSGKPWDWKSFGLSLLGGFVSGAFSAIPVPGFDSLGLFGKVLSYGVSFVWGGIGTAFGAWITGSVNSWETFGMAFALGGAANVIARGVSESIVQFKAGKITNLGNKAKSLEVQKLQGYKGNIGSKALKGSMRNAFKNTTRQEIVKLLGKANPWIRLGVYSAVVSGSLSGWY